MIGKKMAELTKEKAQSLMRALDNVRTTEAFKRVTESPDLRKNNFRKPSYEEFVKNLRTFSSLSYGGAQRKVWDKLAGQLQQEGLSRKLLNDNDVAKDIYNELFVEPGSFAIKYDLEAGAEISSPETAEMPALEERQEEGTASEGESKMEGNDTEVTQPAEEKWALSALMSKEGGNFSEEFLKAKGLTPDSQISYDEYKNLLKEFEDTKEDTAEGNDAEEKGAAKEEKPEAEQGDLEFVTEEAQIENWVEEYDQYLTKYGREHGNPWTCDSKENGLNGHFEKGPQFSYSAPNKVSFAYAEQEKPAPEDFMGPLSLAKDKGMKLSWNRSMSEDSREAIMAACAKVGLDIVGLTEEEQRKFDALREQNNGQQAEEVREAPAAPQNKGMSAILAMRHKLREKHGDYDSAELRDAMLANAGELGLDETSQKTIERRKEIDELKKRGITTYGDDEDCKKLAGLEKENLEERLSRLDDAAKGTPVEERLKARHNDLSMLHNPKAFSEEEIAAAKQREMGIDDKHKAFLAKYQKQQQTNG